MPPHEDDLTSLAQRADLLREITFQSTRKRAHGLDQLKDVALVTMEEVMLHGENDTERRQAASDILDRHPDTVKKAQGSKTLNLNFPMDAAKNALDGLVSLFSGEAVVSQDQANGEKPKNVTPVGEVPP